jgi:chromate transporter
VGTITDIETDEHRGPGFDQSGVGEYPAVKIPAARDRLHQWADALPIGPGVTTDDDVAIDLVFEVGEGGGANILKGGDDRHAGDGGEGLRRLFGSRTGPDSEQAGGTSANCRFKRHGNVDKQCSGLKMVTDLFQCRELGGEGNRKHDDPRGGGSLLVGAPTDLSHQRIRLSGGWNRKRQVKSGGDMTGAIGISRADNDLVAGGDPTSRQAAPLVTGASHDGHNWQIRAGIDRVDFFFHGGDCIIYLTSPSKHENKVCQLTQSNRYKDLQKGLMGGLRAVRQWVGEQFAPEPPRADWRALGRTFLVVGATGFGGGVAVIAQIRRLVVHQRRWLSDEEFLDAVSLSQSLPGANAANAITYIGLKMAGVRGALVSLVSFLLPSFLIMIGLTITHTYLYEIPDARRIFQGFNAAVVGLIVATTVRLGKTAMQQQWHLELGVAVAFLLIFTQTTVVEVVLLAGITGFIIRTWKSRLRHRVRQQWQRERKTQTRQLKAEQQARQHAAEMIERGDRLTGDYQLESTIGRRSGPARGGTNEPPPPPSRPGGTDRLRSFAPVAILAALPLISWPIISKLVVIWQLATIFLRVGTITFGGGFVMIPQIEMDVCDVHRWMDHRTFADGMAFGQITPGPVLITATFIGFKVAGIAGAIVATLAAFLPSFLMTIVAGTSIDRFRTNFQVQAFLSGVAPAVVGMLAAAGVSLAKSGLGTPESYAVATLACLLMLRARLNPVIIIFLCGILQLGISRGIVSWLGVSPI